MLAVLTHLEDSNGFTRAQVFKSIAMLGSGGDVWTAHGTWDEAFQDHNNKLASIQAECDAEGAPNPLFGTLRECHINTDLPFTVSAKDGVLSVSVENHQAHYRTTDLTQAPIDPVPMLAVIRSNYRQKFPFKNQPPANLSF